MHGVQDPVVPILGQWIRETPGTISLGQGMVSYGPPVEAMAAARAALAEGEIHAYGPVEGDRALVEALAVKLAKENDIEVGERSRVVVTAGANMAFINAVLATTDPGDEVILLRPYYFNHEMAIVMAGCRPVGVDTDGRYHPQPEVIRRAISSRTRAVVTVSPNNPTGAVYDRAELAAVSELCREAGVYHIHDEAYEYFVYDHAQHVSPGALPGASSHTISIFSLSKSYGFAGWRIGYMVVPSALIESINKIQDTILICPTRVSQRAALGALEAGGSYCRRHVATLAVVRQTMADHLSGLTGICEAPTPEGAFYCFVRTRSSLAPLELAERLIKDHAVAVVPGSAFGEQRGCTFRLSYGALDPGSANIGLSRLSSGLRALADRA